MDSQNVTKNDDGSVSLHLYVDRASVEVFTKDNTATGANQIFPDATSLGASVIVEGDSAKADITIYPMNSIWKEAETTHIYGDPQFEWNEDHTAATATFTCSDCGQVQTVDCTIEKKVTKQATTTAKGQVTYTATATLGDVTKTNVVTESIPMLDLTSTTIQTENSAKGIALSWSKVKEAAAYRVYRQESDGTWKKLKYTTGMNYTDTAVISGKTYRYKVTAVTDLTNRSESEVVSATYLSQPKFSMTNVSDGIQVNWAKVAGATSYQIYRKNGTDGAWDCVKTVNGGNSNTWKDTSVSNGAQYMYSIKAYSGSVYSSGDYTSGTIICVKSSAVTELTNVSGKKMKVQWQKNSSVTGYQIKYSTSSKYTASTSKLVTIKGNENITKTISNLTKGKTYYVKVRGYITKSGNTSYAAWGTAKQIEITK